MQATTDTRSESPLLLDAGPSERGWHRLENVLRCPRLYALREMDVLPFPMSAPLVNGSLIHIALAHRYQQIKEQQTGGDPNKWFSPEQAIAALAYKNNDESPLWRGAIAHIIEAYCAYNNNWLAEDWKVLEVENEFRARVGAKKHLYTQRADLVVEDPSERVWIVDHKSAYRINSKTLDQYILDGQFIGYQMFGKAIYKDRFAGVILNRIKLSHPYDFDRRPIEPAPAALKSFLATIEEGERRIAAGGQDIDSFPMALNNQTCYGKYGKCGAYDLCRFGV